MKPSAVLLIDLENFYCSREDYCRAGQPYDRTRFAADLDKLLMFARSMTENLPFTVKRAYADFNASRYITGAAPQYYLRQLPDELLQQGVEPVQVFRLSRGGGGRGSKNAADMRMAMDATSLIATAGHVEHFVLVTGDADFIPVILELKRHGHTVSVIGVTGATSPKIQRFVDNFELFEDLLAAEEVEAQSGELTHAGEEIAQIAVSLQRLLARSRPLRFAAIKPLLSKELGHPFDPGVFGCDTTGEFLRNHHAQLGVVIRQGQHDAEIDLPGSVPDATNGVPASRKTPRIVTRPPDKPATKVSAQPEPHTAAHYRQLLTGSREAKVHPVPWSVLVWACDTIVPLLTPPTGEPTHTTRLQPKLVQAAEAASTPELVKHVRLFYPTLRAGLPVQSADGVYSLPEGATGEQVRRSVLSYIGYVLNCRLAESGAAGEILPESLAAVFEPGATLEWSTAEVVAALASPAPVSAPPPTPAPRPTAEEWHTPNGYTKLLKAGGVKGSETESFKVLPVPWPSIERICTDAFAILCPAVGGGPLSRDELNARLIESGKEMYLERYDQHVRRALGILRVAGELIEDGTTISLNPDITAAPDLRNRALAFLLQLLQLRLEEREIYDPIRPDAFVTAIEAGSHTDRLLEEVTPAIAWLYQPAQLGTEVVSNKPVPPTSDSGVVGVALFDTDPELELELSESPPANEPTRANTDPTWEPGLQSPVPQENSVPAETDLTSQTEEALSSGIVDVAAITSEAVAAATEPPAEDVLTIPLAELLPEGDPQFPTPQSGIARIIPPPPAFIPPPLPPPPEPA